MRLVITAVSALFLLSCSCSTIDISGKIRPEYQGVDPKAQKAVDEFFAIADIEGIKFKRKVTVGFKKINKGDVIGMCTYGGRFREVDLDIDFWTNSDGYSKYALVFHELTHCYCGRGHDYKSDKKYPEKLEDRIKVALDWRIHGGERPGYWEDGCAVSLMHPTLIDSECMRTHYQEYIEEMFDRCEPW